MLDDLLLHLPEKSKLILVLPVAPDRLYRIRPTTTRQNLREMIQTWVQYQNLESRIRVIDPTEWILNHRQYYQGRNFLTPRGEKKYAEAWLANLKK